MPRLGLLSTQLLVLLATYCAIELPLWHDVSRSYPYADRSILFLLGAMLEAQLTLLILWEVFGKPRLWQRVVVPITCVVLFSLASHAFEINSSTTSFLLTVGFDFALVALATRFLGLKMGVLSNDVAETGLASGLTISTVAWRAAGLLGLGGAAWLAKNDHWQLTDTNVLASCTILWLSVWALLGRARTVLHCTMLITAAVAFDAARAVFDVLLLGDDELLNLMFVKLALAIAWPLWLIRRHGIRFQWDATWTRWDSRPASTDLHASQP